jgi:hypothetical protein
MKALLCNNEGHIVFVHDKEADVIGEAKPGDVILLLSSREFEAIKKKNTGKYDLGFI